MSDRAWEAIFWDIGGVILDVSSVREAHRRFVGWLLEEYDLEQPKGDALEQWRSTLGAYFEAREGTEVRAARIGYDRAVETIVGDPIEWEPRFETILEERIRPNPHAVETIRELADLECHLGVISDVDTREGVRILETFGVREAFDSVTTSEAVGRTKPDPLIFETALEIAGAPADRSLMIGDRYTHDVEGAARVGLTTIAYGAADGPAVDYRVESLADVPAIVHGERGD